MARRTLRRLFLDSKAEAELIEEREEVIHGQRVKVKVYAPASAIHPFSVSRPINPISQVQPLGGFGSELLGGKIPPARNKKVDKGG